MAESYVTLSEAAELEGIKYKTMAQRLSRKKQAFETKTEKSETGGKDVVLVAVSSLSKQARNACHTYICRLPFGSLQSLKCDLCYPVFFLTSFKTPFKTERALLRHISIISCTKLFCIRFLPIYQSYVQISFS